MFTAQIMNNYLGAVYRFTSSSFKFCYYQSVHFARRVLYMMDNIDCIVITFTGDISVAVSRTGITIITPNRVFLMLRGRERNVYYC